MVEKHNEVLFPTALRSQIEALALRFQRLKKSLGEQAQRTNGPQGFLEFSGHQPYQRGDDLRKLDWAAYSRHKSLYVKTFQPEFEKQVTLIPDLSPSMNYGSPEKRIVALRLCAALAISALRSGARVSLFIPDHQPRLYECTESEAIYEVLSTKTQHKIADFFDWMRENLTQRSKLSRNIIVISDLMAEPKSLAFLGSLRKRGKKLFLLGLVAPEEIKPPFTHKQNYVLEDLESQEKLVLQISEQILQRYHQAFEKHLQTWVSLCHKQGIGFESFVSNTSFEDLFLKLLSQNVLLS